MLTRFDHAIIYVRDLEMAMDRFRRLGFDVQPGGRHPGRGTHNAIIRFGLDYIELMSVYDRAEREALGERGAAILRYIDRREGGVVGYCVAGDALDELAGELSAAGLSLVGPFAMQRMRPDGRVLSWTLLTVDSSAGAGPPLPGFIHWDQPDEERLTWEEPGQHAIGATRVAGLAVAVDDLAGDAGCIERHLGLRRESTDEEAMPEFAVRRVRFSLGNCSVDLLAPTGDGPVRRELDERGPGTFQVTLAVEDLEHARARLVEVGAAPTPAPGVADGWLIPPDAAVGARVVLVAEASSVT